MFVTRAWKSLMAPKSGPERPRMIQPKSWSRGDLIILAENQLFQSLGTSFFKDRTGGRNLKLQHEGFKLDTWKDFLIEMVLNRLERL